jgi:hypothetical protein
MADSERKKQVKINNKNDPEEGRNKEQAFTFLKGI